MRTADSGERLEPMRKHIEENFSPDRFQRKGRSQWSSVKNGIPGGFDPAHLQDPKKQYHGCPVIQARALDINFELDVLS